MIYTVTLNPALDYYMQVEPSLGEICRSQKAYYRVGGKGINVSRALFCWGETTTIVGYVAGFTGEEIYRVLEKEGHVLRLVKLEEGVSRCNVKIMGDKETQLQGIGPRETKKGRKMLLEQLSSVTKEDTVVVAGRGLSLFEMTGYGDLFSLLREKKAKLVLDTTGALLKEGLTYHPWLIKPNKEELVELTGKGLMTVPERIQVAQKMGAKNVLVSLGKEGAILGASDGTCYYQRTVAGDVSSSVGAGDTALAGFLWQWERTKDRKKALSFAVSAGTSLAFSGEIPPLFKVEQMAEKLSLSDSLELF